jgi:hypothetical protein
MRASVSQRNNSGNQRRKPTQGRRSVKMEESQFTSKPSMSNEMRILLFAFQEPLDHHAPAVLQLRCLFEVQKFSTLRTPSERDE